MIETHQAYLRNFCFQLFAICSLFTLIQPVEAGTLTVRALDQSARGRGARAAIENAQICYSTADGSITERKTSDDRGFAIFSNVPQGSITIRVIKSGFVSRQLTAAMPATDLLQEIELQPGTGATLICPTPTARQTLSDLTVSIEQTTTNPVPIGGVVRYSVKARNIASTSASNVLIRVQFPAGFDNASGGGTGLNCNFSSATRIFSCTASTLSGEKTFGVSVQSPKSLINANKLTVIANIDPNNTVPETNEGNNNNSVVTILPGPELSPNLTGSATTASCGQSIPYLLKTGQ